MTFWILSLLVSTATAQTVDVKGADTELETTTTIEIKKSKGTSKPPDASATNSAPKWQVEEDHTQLEGEPSPTPLTARQSWKERCEQWKKEFRAEHKDQQVLKVDCGIAECGGDAGKKVCTSQATYKIRIKSE